MSHNLQNMFCTIMPAHNNVIDCCVSKNTPTRTGKGCIDGLKKNSCRSSARPIIYIHIHAVRLKTT